MEKEKEYPTRIELCFLLNDDGSLGKLDYTGDLLSRERVDLSKDEILLFRSRAKSVKFGGNVYRKMQSEDIAEVVDGIGMFKMRYESIAKK
jgi:hypothetical protein